MVAIMTKRLCIYHRCNVVTLPNSNTHKSIPLASPLACPLYSPLALVVCYTWHCALLSPLYPCDEGSPVHGERQLLTWVSASRTRVLSIRPIAVKLHYKLLLDQWLGRGSGSVSSLLVAHLDEEASAYRQNPGLTQGFSQPESLRPQLTVHSVLGTQLLQQAFDACT